MTKKKALSPEAAIALLKKRCAALERKIDGKDEVIDQLLVKVERLQDELCSERQFQVDMARRMSWGARMQ